MTVPADQRATLMRYLRVQDLTDREIRALLRQAARDLANAVEDAAPTGFGDAVRLAQLRLRQRVIADELWTRVGSRVTIGQRRAIKAAVEGAQTDLPSLLRNLPRLVRETLLEGAERAASGAVERAVARLGGRAQVLLSPRVYWQQALMRGTVDRLINSALARGLSAREMALEVRRYVSPSTPGGTSYAAMRLGRSEVNNSFHAATVEHWSESPFVTGMKWNLSRSHPRADTCDDYAHEDHDRLGAGIFRKENVPPKPHPQCFCYVVPSTPDDDEIVANFIAGRYNSFLSSVGTGI